MNNEEIMQYFAEHISRLEDRKREIEEAYSNEFGIEIVNKKDYVPNEIDINSRYRENLENDYESIKDEIKKCEDDRKILEQGEERKIRLQERLERHERRLQQLLHDKEEAEYAFANETKGGRVDEDGRAKIESELKKINDEIRKANATLKRIQSDINKINETRENILKKYKINEKNQEKVDEPDEIEQDEVGPDEIEPDEIEQDEVEPDEVEPDEVEPDEIEPDEIEPDEVEPDEIEPDEIEPDADTYELPDGTVIPRRELPPKSNKIKGELPPKSDRIKGELPPKKDDLGDTRRKNLPIRSFEEIYDATCTEHCGTLPRTIHYLAKAPFFTFTSKREDTVGKILGLAGDIASFPVKLLAKPINAVLRTDRKFDRMYRDIETLARENPQEFAVLTESSEEANRLFGNIKDERDKDHLSPTFMKQRKVNNLYLDAVQLVYTNQQREIVDFVNEKIGKYSDRIQELMDKADRGETLTQDENDELEILGTVKDELEKEGDRASDKVDLFAHGAERKSSSYRNISGWFLGKYNPDNRKLNHEMAELSRQRREALSRGDDKLATQLTQRMDNLVRSETDIRQVGFNKNNLIDRGKTSVKRESTCEILDAGPQRKFQQLLSTTAIGAAAFRTFTTWYENSKLKELIESHNNDIKSVNAQNQSIAYSGNATVATKKEIDAAADDLAHTKVAGAHGIGEHANLDKGANETGGDWIDALRDPKYKGRDDALHASTSDVAQKVQNATTPLDGADIASQYYSEMQQTAISTFKQYCQTRNFDYDGIMWGLGGQDGILALLKKLGDGTVSYSGKVTGVMAPEMQSFELSNLPDYIMDTIVELGIVAQRRKMDVERVKQERKAPRGRSDREDVQEVEDNQEHTTENGGRLIDIEEGTYVDTSRDDDDYEL